MRARRHAALLAAALAGCACGASAADAAADAQGWSWQLPRGFPTPAVPADNPMSAAKVALGRRLFFEPRLAVNGRYSCASCHDPVRAFSDGRPVAVGATGAKLAHNAMALANVAYNLSFGWSTPQLRSLEAQMRVPLLNTHPIELGARGRERALCAQLAADPEYAAAFTAVFPGEAAGTPGVAGAPVSLEHIVKAIAAFERTLISGGSPFDRYVFGGEHAALSVEAKRGMALFFSARVGCASCHAGFNFAGNWRDAQGATGKASFASNGTSVRPVRVPTLRNVALTAPYMHDGRFATLPAVLGYYAQLGARTAAAPGTAPDPRLPRAPLSATEQAALVAFLDSLTDESFIARFAGTP